MNNKGVSLIEVIVSAALLTIVFLPLMYVFSASAINNRMSGDFISNKYLAEKYMEIVKSADITQLINDGVPLIQMGFERFGEDALLDKGYSLNDVVFQNISEGAVIKINETNIKTSGGVIFDKDDYSELSINELVKLNNKFNISINLDESTDTIEIIDENAGMPVNTIDAPIGGGSFYIKLNFDDGEENIAVKNLTPYKAELYCSYVGVSASGWVMPAFEIVEGKVAFYDITVPNDRLDGETDDLFLKGEDEAALTLSYSVSVEIDNESGTYILNGLKVIN